MTELLNCPFCGADRIQLYVAKTYDCVKIGCLSCSAQFLLANHFGNNKEAVVSAWNVRTERTCELDVLDTGNEAAYEHYEYIMHCLNCHHEFGYVQYNEDGETWQNEKPKHCPNCGGKVEQ